MQEQAHSIEHGAPKPDNVAVTDRLQKIRDLLKEVRIAFPKDEARKEVSSNETTITFTEDEIARLTPSKLKGAVHYVPSTLREVIPERFVQNVRNLDLDPQEWKRAILKHPQLFYQLPETVNANIEQAAEKLGVSKAQYTKSALRQPSLFSFSPETINTNIEQAAEKLGVSKAQYVEAALKQPSLFSFSPETVNTHVEQAAEKLGVSKAQYTKTALRQPSLFAQSPETVNTNIEQAAEKLGVSKAQYVEAALKQPSLFTMSPGTIENKYKLYSKLINGPQREVSNRFLRLPALLTYAPERILAHYALAKLKGNTELRLSSLLKHPLRLAEEDLDSQTLEKYRNAYDYLVKLSKTRRQIKRNIARDAEHRAYESHARFIERYFGKSGEPLTKDDFAKIDELIESVSRKL